MLKQINNTFKIVKYKIRFYKEYDHFQKTGVSTNKGYSLLRKLFTLTKGQINDDLSLQIAKGVGKYDDIPSKGVLGDLSTSQLSVMTNKMKQEGYLVFDTVLPETTVQAIYDYCSKTPVSYLDVTSDSQNYSENKVIFDENNPISPRYQFTVEEIFNCAPLQELIFDSSLLAFAQEYLGCKPILDLVACWWSAPFKGLGKNAAAQMYHFDLDRIKFMKFFFYITDVDTDTGPHCFVKGSHGILPKKIDRDGRFEDSEIQEVYGKENMMELCGKKGSIIAVDTRGFHKGKDLLKGKRLLFQIQFTNSLFGQSYKTIDHSHINKQHTNQVEQYSYTYSSIS